MGIERHSSEIDPDNSSDIRQSEPDQKPPPDRPAEPGAPSRAESRRLTMAPNQKASKPSTNAADDLERKGTSNATAVQKSLRERTSDSVGKDDQTLREDREESGSTAELTGHRQADSPVNPKEDRPSYSGFDNLAQEFDARAKSREQANAFNAEASGLTYSRLNDKAIKEKIDPYAPDFSKADGYKEPFQRATKNKDEERTDGVDSFNELPAGDKLLEKDDEESKAERFSAKMLQKADNFDSNAKKLGNAIDKLIGPKPTGAETRVNKGPMAVDPHHSSVDAGSTAAALLALGVVSAEVVRRVHGKMKAGEAS